MNMAISAETIPHLEQLRQEFELPAIAAAVTRMEETIAASATGVRIMGKRAKVTVEDRFHIGSVTKPMTATMIATLVEDSKPS